MKYFKAIVSYVGENYCGWQSQKRGDSIQENIGSIISSINGGRTHIVGSGRTDAGVNALGQCFHFSCEREISAYQWLGIFHSFLPKDIYVRSVEEVDEDFHARFLVEKKTYLYRINLGEYDVFLKDSAWQLQEILNVELMKEAWSYFQGEHDFLSFNRSNVNEYPNQWRKMFEVRLWQEGNQLFFLVTGNGFLRHMVRTMVGTCVEVGRGRLSLDKFKLMLDQPSRQYSTKRAPAYGLCLKEVSYHSCLGRNHAYLLRTVSDADGYDEKVAYELHNRKEKGQSLFFDKNGALLDGHLPKDVFFLEIVEKASQKGVNIH